MKSEWRATSATVGGRLKELRLRSGFQAGVLADSLGWSASKVSKIENGRQLATAEDISAWLIVLGATHLEDELLARIRPAGQSSADWRSQLGHGTRVRQDEAVALEADAHVISAFETACVPGLLQTRGYATAMLELTARLHGVPMDVRESVESRLRRQDVLYDSGRELTFVIWEPALQVCYGSVDVMASQLDRLLSAIVSATVDVRIVPTPSVLEFVPSHGFWIFDDQYVLVETIGRELRVETQLGLEAYRRTWSSLVSAAVSGDAASRVVARAQERVMAYGRQRQKI